MRGSFMIFAGIESLASRLTRRELDAYNDFMSGGYKSLKPKIKKENGYWVLISSCGNFKEQYVSLAQVLRRLGEFK